MAGSTKDDAQRRADQIRAFRSELAALRREGIEPVLPDRLDALNAHHDALVATLSDRFDIDTTVSAKRMSIGMRLASAFGAAALTAAIVSFFYRIWGDLSMAAQVAFLTLAPCVAIGAMVLAAGRERTLYVASLCGVVACGAFVLQTVMLGKIFNLPGSPHVLGAWAAFALAVALPFRFALPSVAAAGAFICYLAALIVSLQGAPWFEFVARAETIMIPAALVYAAWRVMPVELQPWLRGTALTLGLGSLLAMSTFETSSLLPWSRSVLEASYQILALVIAIAVVALGVRTGREETLVAGALFTALFIIGRFVDWWWDWMPKYLFFLGLAALAIAWLMLLGRLRRRMAAVAS
jgi:hypothetical protein